MESPLFTDLKIGPYKVQEVVGRGSFGTVYKALSDDGQTVAIKIANHANRDQATPELDESVAFGLYSGGFGVINPAPVALFQIQSQRSQTSRVIPDTQGPFVIADVTFLVMEHVRGMTLRRLLDQNLSPGEDTAINALDLATKVFEAIAQLERSSLEYHGDLKPANVILSGSGVRILDPGYFGPIACSEGMIPNAVITTPAYYPCLEPDDSFACASILWEIAAGRHPLKESDRAQLDCGPKLEQWIASQELIGRYFLSPIAKLSVPDVAPEIQELLFSSLGLEVTDSKKVLEKKAAPLKASQILTALNKLKKSGVSNLRLQ